MSNPNRLDYLRGYLHGLRLSSRRIAERNAAYYAVHGNVREEARWRGIAEGVAMAVASIEAALNERRWTPNDAFRESETA